MPHISARVRLTIAAGMLGLFPIVVSAVSCVAAVSGLSPPDGEAVQMSSVKGKLAQLVNGGFYFYSYLKESDQGIYSVYALGGVTVALHKTKPYLLMIYKDDETQYGYRCASVVQVIKE